MTAINASPGAYEKILDQRHFMEEASGRVVSISDALDALMEGIYEGGKKHPTKIEDVSSE